MANKPLKVLVVGGDSKNAQPVQRAAEEKSASSIVTAWESATWAKRLMSQKMFART